MFGPLNGVRTALVVLAVIAALASALVGEFLAAAVILMAVLVHGVGWLFLYSKRDQNQQG